jgi:hypothetical protein
VETEDIIYSRRIRFNWLIAEVERLKMEVHSRTIGERDANAVISRQAGTLGELRERLQAIEDTESVVELERQDLGYEAVTAAYQKGQEDMRESTGEWADRHLGYHAGDAIRALPIKEAALSAKEGEK